jgi:hypothetical protein
MEWRLTNISSRIDMTSVKRILLYPEAIREALDQEMEKDPTVFVMGLGVDDPKIRSPADL